VRHGLIEELRAAIASGDYPGDALLDCAVGRMIDEVARGTPG
jgi:hypothetical protein